METFPIDTGQEEEQTEQRSFSLPNEIWTIILDHVERNNDLLNCRKVNSLWYSICTSICRHHFVRLNFDILEDRHDNLPSFYSTFKNCYNLPWSACEIHVDTTTPSIQNSSLPKIREFIHLYGKDISELTISGGRLENNEKLLIIINGIPEIKYLDISGITITQPIRESFTTQLARLTGLIATTFPYHNFWLLEQILCRPEVQLKSLQLKVVIHFWPIEKCEHLSSLIIGIPTLHLDVDPFYPEFFIQLSKKRVQVQSLNLHLGISTFVQIPHSYSSLEIFMENTATSLQKLILHDNQQEIQRRNSKLTIPTLPKLTYLGIKDKTKLGCSLISNITLLTQVQFPSLTKVMICTNSTCERGTLNFFDSLPLTTVTHLGLFDNGGHKQYCFQTNWHRIFPNLVQLEAETDGMGLQHVLTNFQNLEQLSLTVWCPLNQPLGNVLTILSGEEQFGSETLGDKYQSQEGESRNDSILSLKRLKIFKLRLEHEHKISESFLNSYFLKIQPLNLLHMENLIVSEEYKEKLQKYHRKVEIYEHSDLRPSYHSNFEEMR